MPAPHKPLPTSRSTRANCQMKKATALRGFVLACGRFELFGVLVFVDGLADAVLALVEMILLSLGQMSAMLGHVALLLVLNALFALFQMRGLSRRQLAVLYAVRDALLLVGFAAIDLVHARMAGIDLPRTGLRLCGSGPNKHQTTRRQN